MTKLTQKELEKRVSEVWENFPYCWEEIYAVEECEDDPGRVYVHFGYCSNPPQCKWIWKSIKLGLKRRPQAREYVLGLRDDFND